MTFCQAPGACKLDFLGLLLMLPSLIYLLHQTDACFAVVLPRRFWCPTPGIDALTQTLEVVCY